MNKQLRSLILTATVLLGTVAFAQPLPPYYVTVTGTVAGCTPGGFVNIITVQNTQPPLDIDVPLDSNCTYAIDLAMDSPLGWFQVSTPCNGAIQTGTGNYAVNIFDSLFVVVVDLNCGGANLDCMGVPGGSALPGTPCDDGNADTTGDIWTAACTCVGMDSTYYDCLQILNGPNVPGAPCDDSDPNTFNDLWTATCACIGTDSTYYDCLQIPNGPNVPGTPCTLSGGNVLGTWSAACVCVADSSNSTCEAGFFVMQAYQWVDSAGSGNGGGGDPIPNELWVWNLSNGGTGNFQFTWDFGDGTSSTEAFPTHTYSSGSAYLLCLTIADDAGCTDTYCDSVSVDGDGLIDGLVAAGSRSTFTINVMNPLSTSVQEKPAFSELNTWPNPVNDVLNIALTSELKGTVQVRIADLSGRVVNTDSRSIVHGNNRLEVPVTDLSPGLYLVQLSNGKASISSRFVKVQ